MNAAVLRLPMQVELLGHTMGTRWSVRLWGALLPPLSRLREGIQAVLDDTVAQMSTWEPTSALCAYNRAPAGAWVPLPAAFAEVMRCALEVARTSDGAADPTIGPLVDLWGFGPPGPMPCPPASEALSQARRRVGWQRLHFEQGRLLQPGGVALDLSWIAKGHATDRVARWLREAGVAHALIDVGGELRAMGHRTDGQPWHVQVTLPGTEDHTGPVLGLRDLAVATSGDGLRHVIHAGRRYGHTLDPRTGAPVTHSLASVTVIHDHCMQADAWATALTVLGPEAGPALARRLHLSALFVARSTHSAGELDLAMTGAFEAALVH